MFAEKNRGKDVIMKISDEDRSVLRHLEESLWIIETRFDFDYMNRILAPDFFEFGRSGRIYQRADTLAVEKQEIKAEIPLKDFTIHSISQDVVLITYISRVKNEKLDVGNRSSIWSKNAEGWQLRFHQGTAVN